MRITIFLFSLLFSISVSAQSKLLKGRIIDSSSQDGIAYTNIGVEGTFYGTASDAEGFFELKIPDNYLNEMLYISAVGYKIETLQLNQLVSKEFSLIKLTAQTYDIEGVDVAAQSRVLFRMIKTASERIPQNYSNGALSMKIFYTESLSADENSTQTREAVIELYDENGYAKPSILDAFQNRNYRFTQSKKNFDPYSFPEGSTGFDELLEMDLARSANTLLNNKILNDYDLQLEGTSSFEGDSVWIISYRTTKADLAHTGDFFAKKIDGKIYISKTDYGIIRIESAIESSKNNPQNRSLSTKENGQHNVRYHFISTYKKQDGKYALAYIECNKTYLNEKNKAMSYTRKASVLDIHKSVDKIIGKDYFEDEAFVDSFWKSFQKPY